MGKKTDRFQKWRRSLSVRLTSMFVVSGLLIMIIVVPIVYRWVYARMVRDYTRMAAGLTNLMAMYLDGKRVDEYIRKNRQLEDYGQIRRQLCDIKNNYPDVEYAHVLRFQKEGSLVVFNLQDTGRRAIGVPGQLVKMEPAFASHLPDLMVGQETWFTTDDTNEGYLLTYFRPVFDDTGKYQCHVCVAFSMENLHQENLIFLNGMLIVFGAVLAIILAIDVMIIRKRVTRPLTDMTHCAAKFAYDTEQDRFMNVQIMEELNIQTHDEIEELYYEFMSVMKETLYYVTNLNRAKNNIQEQEQKIDQISETAYKDSLTRVGNQAAFNRVSEVLAKAMTEKRAEFAIVMVDINDLKYVNDTFGHKFGDSYIKGCCNIICNVYKRSPVFRVGGDEFIVVLRNEDYMSRLLRMTQIREAFKASFGNEDKERWERYSASVGMAECEPSDETVDQVMKRADAAMYESKMQFKKKYGSYR